MVNSKVIVLLVVVAVAMAYPSGYQQAPQQQQYPEPYEERDYKFSYSVKDDPTYNQQTREENKYGNTITGQYTVLEPTGELRVVNYIADDNGFRADVQNQPQSGGYAAPAPQKQAPAYGAPSGYGH